MFKRNLCAILYCRLPAIVLSLEWEEPSTHDSERLLHERRMSAEDGEHRHPQVEPTGAIMKIAGILLIIAGVVALLYGGISFTSHKKAVDLGAIQIDRTELSRAA